MTDKIETPIQRAFRLKQEKLAQKKRPRVAEPFSASRTSASTRVNPARG